MLLLIIFARKWKFFLEAITNFKSDLPTILNSLRDLIAKESKNNHIFFKLGISFWGFVKIRLILNLISLMCRKWLFDTSWLKIFFWIFFMSLSFIERTILLKNYRMFWILFYWYKLPKYFEFYWALLWSN